MTDTTEENTDPVIYVDIPTREMIGDPDGSWLNVGRFKTKEEAVAWIRENIGHCDDDGKISLLTNA